MTIQEISHNLCTQDNRITVDPIFVVEEEKFIYGVDPDFSSDGYVWVNQDSLYGDKIEATEEEAALLEEYVEDPDKFWNNHPQNDNGCMLLDSDDEFDPTEWEMVYYIKQWVFVTACLTEAGCLEFINRDKHNHGNMRIFAYGSYKNNEWHEVRKHFMEMNKQVVTKDQQSL